MHRPTIGTTNRPGFIVSLACLGLALAGPAGAAGSFDGTYKGTQRVMRSNNSQQCELLTDRTTWWSSSVTITSIAAGTRPSIGIDVSPDGTFHQTQMITVGRRQAVVQVNGKITGASFEGDIGTDACAAHLSLTKS